MPFTNENRIYVGNLARNCRENDVEKFVQGFGRVEQLMFKGTYAFIEFEDHRDAEDAVDELDGKKLLGERVIVEHARGTPKEERWRYGGGGGRDGGRDRYGGGGGGGGSRYGRGRSPPGRGRPRWEDKYGPIQRTKYRLTVENLSSRVSWQDLKDFMRQIGEVTYADAHRDRKNEGNVEFTCKSDITKAIDKLDGSELQGRKIRLIDYSSRSRSRSDSRSPRRRRSRSRGRRSRTKSRTRSKSRSKSGSRSRSGSRKRSRSRSGDRRRRKSSKSKSRSKTKSRSRSKSAEKKDGADDAADAGKAAADGEDAKQNGENGETMEEM